MLPDPMSAFSNEATQHVINVIPMNFRKDFVPVPGKPGEFKEVHKVDLVRKGTNGESTPWSIRALEKEQLIWPHIRPYYEAWLKGQEEPTEGTPVDVLPFLPPGLVPHLKSLHIRTAEDLAAVTDADMQRIGMSARMYREKARAYVEAKGDAAKIAEANADLKAENANLRTELDELKALVNSMAADRPKVAKPADMAGRR